MTSWVTTKPSPDGWLSRGAYTDRVPLDLPPAPGGLVPQLALVADSGVRDGPMGTGWTIGGLSRFSQRWEPDGTAVYSLDGMDLVYLDGAWYPEVWDGSVLEYDDETFVWTRTMNGATWTYGESDGFGAHTGRVRLLAEQLDRSGNGILVQYAQGACSVGDVDCSTLGGDSADEASMEPVLSVVRYGSATSRATARFHYEARPDPRFDASHGRKNVLLDRLVAVTAAVDREACSSVLVEYRDSDAHLSVVSRIVRESVTSGPDKDLRVLATAGDTDSLEADSWSLDLDFSEDLVVPGGEYLGSNNQWLQGHVVSLNGDALPDLVLLHFACEEGALIEGDYGSQYGHGGSTSVCEIEPGVYLNEARSRLETSAIASEIGRSSLAESDAQRVSQRAPEFVYDADLTDQLEGIFRDRNGGVAYAWVDLNRDGFDELIIEPGPYYSWESWSSVSDFELTIGRAIPAEQHVLVETFGNRWDDNFDEPL